MREIKVSNRKVTIDGAEHTMLEWSKEMCDEFNSGETAIICDEIIIALEKMYTFSTEEKTFSPG